MLQTPEEKKAFSAWVDVQCRWLDLKEVINKNKDWRGLCCLPVVDYIEKFEKSLEVLLKEIRSGLRQKTKKSAAKPRPQLIDHEKGKVK